VTKPANGTTYNFLQLLLNFSASSTLGIQTYWFNNGSANTTYTSPAFWNTTYWLNNYIFYANNSAGCVNSSLKSFFTLNCTDYDNDGYGGAGGNCTLPLDCNDNNASIYQNLYGFLDSDGDAYTTGPNTTICSGASLPSNYRVANTTTDCNDANSSLYQNISGYVDADADGYGGGSALNVCSGASLPSGYSAVGGDCNDASASISPAVTEACSDNVDNDCDGSIDEGCSSSTASSSCFISGTKIKMADGADKNIEDVKTGEFVSSFDEDFKFTSSQVLELESPIREGYYLIEFEDGSSLKLTEEHPIWIGKK
jgi:hypothetical protein